MNKIKTYILIVLVLGLIAIPSAQSASQQGLSARQLADVVNTNLNACRTKTPIVPQRTARAFSINRIERTLHGVWRGRVKGNYDTRLLAKDGFLNVDYCMIVDTKRHEALVFEQFGPNRAIARGKAGAPDWTYVMCGEEKYLPRHPAQVHEFQKVSDNIEDARELLRTSTGLTFDDNRGLELSAIWKRLVDSKYFDTPRSLAFAGSLFKPFEIEVVSNEERGSLLAMKIQTEYRGGGQTAARFQPGVPMRGFEEGHFIGVTTRSGDYLVSTIGNGVAMRKAVTDGGLIHMFFDKVVIGPLAR